MCQSGMENNSLSIFPVIGGCRLPSLSLSLVLSRQTLAMDSSTAVDISNYDSTTEDVVDATTAAAAAACG